MGTISARIRTGMCVFALLFVAACGNLDRKHGYVPSAADLEQIVVGVDTKDTVAELVGRPSTAGVLSDGGWYYVASKFRAYGLRERTEISREVLAISFDDDGVVENIERFGLEDGRVVALSRRVTESNIKGISFLRQLFGNFGNFAAENLLGGG